MREMSTRRARQTATAVLGALALLALTVVWAPSASAAPKLSVSATSGLTDGQTIQVSGTGFQPNLKGIAVGQCKVGYQGPSDCNLQGGATFRNADANGSIGQITLKLATSFGGIDCTTTDCVIAAAPLPSSADAATVSANTAVVPLTFGSTDTGADTSTDTSADTSTDTSADTSTDTSADTSTEASDLPQTGAGDSLPVLVLAGSALLLTGAGLGLLVPRQRRRGSPA